MKFLADMGISPKTARALRARDHDAVHLHDQGLDRLPDSAILDKARDEGRILLTHDLDFGELMAASGADLPSVIIFRLHDMRPTTVERHLAEIIARHRQALEAGAVVSVTEGRIRLRSLPIRPGG